MYGEILKNLRIKKGLTQQQLAEIIGFKSASAVGMLEREERELSIETIIRITNYFNITSDYLMGIDANPREVVSHSPLEQVENFEDAEDALKFILSQPVLAAYGGYDLNNMSDEEIIEIANDMLFAMKLSLEKLKKKNKQL